MVGLYYGDLGFDFGLYCVCVGVDFVVFCVFYFGCCGGWIFFWCGVVFDLLGVIGILCLYCGVVYGGDFGGQFCGFVGFGVVVVDGWYWWIVWLVLVVFVGRVVDCVVGCGLFVFFDGLFGLGVLV